MYEEKMLTPADPNSVVKINYISTCKMSWITGYFTRSNLNKSIKYYWLEGNNNALFPETLTITRGEAKGNSWCRGEQ